jgi:hypothetical protein
MCKYKHTMYIQFSYRLQVLVSRLWIAVVGNYRGSTYVKVSNKFAKQTEKAFEEQFAAEQFTNVRTGDWLIPIHIKTSNN